MEESGQIEFPEGFSPELREQWLRLAERSRRLGASIMEQNAIGVDAQPLLLSYLEAHEAVEQAAEKLREEGPVIQDRFKQYKRNPWADILRDRTTEMHRAFRLLGFDQEPRGAGEQGKLFG